MERVKQRATIKYLWLKQMATTQINQDLVGILGESSIPFLKNGVVRLNVAGSLALPPKEILKILIRK